VSWQRVSVPHDWAIYGPFDRAHDLQHTVIKEDAETRTADHTGRTGGLPHVGVGWYRREFTLPDDAAGKRVYVEFDGVMRNAEVFVNGERAGAWPYGYSSFCFDISELVEAGARNVLAVRCAPSCARPTAPQSPRMSPRPRSMARPRSLRSCGCASRRSGMWTGRSCTRWTARRRAAGSGRCGFFLNERPLKFRGVCMHHDLGALGAAVNRRAIERQLPILKEMGCNALRTSHNPPAPEVLEVCDELGLLVIDEAFDEWKGAPATERAIRTAGAPARLELVADRTEIAADGRDLSFVTARVLDADGNLCPHADDAVTFSVEGADPGVTGSTGR